MMFGTSKLTNIPQAEIRQCNPKNDPGYIHLYSSVRTDEVLRISDVRFSHYHDLDHDKEIILTCGACLLTCKGQSIYVYGWSETVNDILFLYRFITMPKPAFTVKNLEEEKKESTNLMRMKEMMMNIDTVSFTRYVFISQLRD